MVQDLDITNALGGTYTAQEAMGALNMSSSKFYRFLEKMEQENHPIKRYRVTERTFVYDKLQIDEVAPQFKNRVSRRGRPSNRKNEIKRIPQEDLEVLQEEPAIDIVLPEDLPALYYMESIQLGWQQAISPTTILSWLNKNDHLYWMQYDKEKRHDVNGVWAVLGILPLQEELINRLLLGEILPHQITTDDVLVYEPGKKYSCYITSTTALPKHQAAIRQLLQYLLAYWCEKSIQVEKLYALAPETASETPLMRLVSECFFAPLERYGDNSSSIAWSLRFSRYNPSIFIQEYQKCIERAQSLERVKEMSMVIDAPEKLEPLLIEKELEGSIKTKLRDFERIQRRLYNIGSNGRMEDERVKRDVWFRRVRSDDDIRACLRINASLFGESKKFSEDELVAQRRVWLTKNPDIYRVLEIDHEIVGFISAFPLPMDTIQRILRGEIKMGDLNIDDLQIYKPGVPVNIYLQTIGVHKRYQGKEKRALGIYMASGFRDMINESGKLGIEIQSVYTRSDEVDGINMSYGLGFEKMPPIPGVEKLVFQLDFSRRDKPFLFEYQHALEEYQAKRSAHAIRSANR